MPIKIEIGQAWKYEGINTLFLVTNISPPGMFRLCKVMAIKYVNGVEIMEVHFINVTADGYTTDLAGPWSLIHYYKPRRSGKVIPDIPLDPALPILMAGHLQDRQRKKYRHSK